MNNPNENSGKTEEDPEEDLRRTIECLRRQSRITPPSARDPFLLIPPTVLQRATDV